MSEEEIKEKSHDEDNKIEFSSNGKLALITGGTRGIGRAMSIMLKNNGYNIIANYLSDDEQAKKFSAEYNIPIYKFDASDFKQCEEQIVKIEKDFCSNIKVLINNAGVTADKMLHKMPVEDFQRVINVNLGSCFNTCRLIYPKMRENGYGRIINISSINAMTGCVGQTNYVASKAAIVGFTKSLALECASKGVTVNAIAPGYTDTEMLRTIDSKILESIIRAIPAKRLARPEEIAGVALFLLSDAAAYITGATININGGQFM